MSEKRIGNKAQIKIITFIAMILVIASTFVMVGNVGAFDTDDVIVNHSKDFDNNEANISVEIQNNINLTSVTIYETNSTFANQTELTNWTFANANTSQDVSYVWTNLSEGNSYYYKVEVIENGTYYNVTKTIDFTEATGGGGLLDIDTSGWFDFLPDWWPSVDWDMSVYEGVARLWHFMVGLPILVVLGAIGVVYWWRR